MTTTANSQSPAIGLFTERFGGAPDGLWRAPGRVNLIGEHTDYNDGFVLPFAIDRGTTAALALRDDRRIRVATTFADGVVMTDLDALSPDAIGGWSAYPLGVAWAFGQFGVDLASAPGFDLALDSDVPVGAGLSSSAAIEMATAVALNERWAAKLDRSTLAQIGRRAENAAVGAPTGIMDQCASVFGEVNTAVFLDCRSLQVSQVPLGFADADLALLVVDTRVEHAHSTGGYRDRREACERGARALGVAALRDVPLDDLDRAATLLDDVTFRRVRHIVTEDARVEQAVAALRREDLEGFGSLLTASHASMRDDFEISVPELNTVVETALAAGALGARMTGGGFGGAAIALIDRGAVDQLVRDVETAFADRGFRAPAAFTVLPSAGATRIR